MRKLIIFIIGILSSAAFFFATIKYENWWYLAGAIPCLIIAVTAIVMFAFRKSSAKIKMLSDRLDVWNNVSYHVNQAGDEAFNELPIGIIIYDETYHIKWGNKFAKQIFHSRFLESSLGDIQNGFIENLESKAPTFVLFYEDKYYDIVHNSTNRLLYFFDQTSREKKNIQYNNRITALGIIMIDNLEESLKNYAVQEKSNIRGQFLGEISDYVRDYGAFLQSVTDDKLIMIMDKENLLKMVENKFDILNHARDIAAKNHLRTSISIGVACYDVEADELAALAQSAVDLAERRGGDQAVINIQNEKITYFGGKTEAIEKNSLVQARMQAATLKEAIESSTNVYITGHALPDADCIGAMIGVLKMAISSQKDAEIVIDKEKLDAISTKMLQAIKDDDPALYEKIIDITKVDIKANTLLIICDTQSPKIMTYPELYKNIQRVYVIDHHRSGEIGYENTISSYIETYASSTVELVSEMFMFYNNDISLLPVEASIMLGGIIIDTNNFTFRSSARTFEAASILREMGADMIMVRKMLRDDITVEQQIASAVMKAKIILNQFAIVKFDDNDIIEDRSTLAKISDKLLEIDGVKASFTIAKLEENCIGVSARSLDTYNVQLIMEEMHGGGHLNSAATQISDTTVAQVEENLIEILKRENEDTEEEKMKVILLEDVKGRGKKNEIIDVANGYGNYLLTNNLAVAATPENIKKVEDAKKQALVDEENHRKLMEKLKTEIESKPINVYIKLGADGKTFGHITSKQIADEYEAQTGITIDKRKLNLPAEINSVGIFTATVDLSKDVVAQIEIHVLEK